MYYCDTLWQELGVGKGTSEALEVLMTPFYTIGKYFPCSQERRYSNPPFFKLERSQSCKESATRSGRFASNNARTKDWLRTLNPGR